jgi:hypothetical protein
MHKSIVKRIKKIESQTFQPRWLAVVLDDGLYFGDCGEGLTKSQFDGWTVQQDYDTQIIIIEVTRDQPNSEGGTIIFKVENLAHKNTTDFLRGYDDLIKVSQCPETEIIAKSVESQVSSVDPNCGCFTAEQANVIAQAQEIIRNAPIH